GELRCCPVNSREGTFSPRGQIFAPAKSAFPPSLAVKGRMRGDNKQTTLFSMILYSLTPTLSQRERGANENAVLGIVGFGVQFILRRQAVVDHHRLTVAQFEHTGAGYHVALFQTGLDRDEIAL